MVYSGDEDCGDDITSGPGVDPIDDCTCWADGGDGPDGCGSSHRGRHIHMGERCPVHPNAKVLG